MKPFFRPIMTLKHISLSTAHRWIYDLSDSHVFLQYFAWVAYSMILMCFAAGFANIVSPQAVGETHTHTHTLSIIIFKAKHHLCFFR